MRDTIKSCAKKIGQRFRQLGEGVRELVIHLITLEIPNLMTFLNLMVMNGLKKVKQKKISQEITMSYLLVVETCATLVLTAASLPARVPGKPSHHPR